MNIKQQLLKNIKDFANKMLIQSLPKVTKKELYKEGALFYHNGNGTIDTWEQQGRTCPFIIYYNREPKHFAVSVSVTKQGFLSGFFTKYNGDEYEIYELASDGYIGKEAANIVAKMLYQEFDCQKEINSEVIIDEQV